MDLLGASHQELPETTPAPQRSWKTIGLFFTNREEIIQRQLKGILHTIVFELLQIQPKLIDEVLEFGKAKNVLLNQTTQDGDSNAIRFEWTTHSLQQALLHCKSLTDLQFNVCFFNDGLDEHEGDQKAMANFLQELGKDSKPGCAHMKICVASRPEQALQDIYSIYLTFAMQDFTASDISSYVRQTLEEHPRLQELIEIGVDKVEISALFDDVARKSEGDFQWVVLVTREIELALSQGLDALNSNERGKIAALRQLVQETPPELHDYYRQTLLERIDLASRRKAYIMLESILREFGAARDDCVNARTDGEWNLPSSRQTGRSDTARPKNLCRPQGPGTSD